jgi:hypothetical protein
MTQTAKPTPKSLCPSQTSIGPDAQIFGILTESAGEGFQVGYLTEALPATPELLAAAAPARPTEVFRAAAPCVERRGAIRPACRWFGQEGPKACLRCPQIATKQRNPTELERVIADCS